MVSIVSIRDRRALLRGSLIQHVRHLITHEGLAAVQARRLAQLASCSVGAIYTIFPDLDDLIITANAETLERLVAHQRLAQERLAADATRAARLLALTMAYLDFAHANVHAWRALFEYRAAPHRPYPDWYIQLQLKPIAHIEEIILARGQDRSSGGELHRLARALWAAIHGIVLSGMDGRLGPQARQEVEAQACLLVTIAVQGLETILEMKRIG